MQTFYAPREASLHTHNVARTLPAVHRPAGTARTQSAVSVHRLVDGARRGQLAAAPSAFALVRSEQAEQVDQGPCQGGLGGQVAARIALLHRRTAKYTKTLQSFECKKRRN